MARSTAAGAVSPFHVKHLRSPNEGPLPTQPGPTRAEWSLVVALFLIGTGLRCAYPSRMAIEHFDEGVYASNIWFNAEDGFHYPAQHLFAPPLLPSLIETVLLLFGPSNFGAILPSLVAGCLTIPLVWWVAREWFGTTAGIASATLAALSDPHIVFCRTALTDVLLCFWLLLAVYFIWRALTLGGRWTTVAAGLFTGLAWWTKYNGWLPLAIGCAGLVPWCALPKWKRPTGFSNFGFSISQAITAPGDSLHGRRDTRQSEPIEVKTELAAALLHFLAIAAIAFAAWSPWLWSLQSKGGYVAVAENHRGYLVGFAGWLAACQTQCGNLTLLEGTAGQHAPLAAWLMAAIWGGAGTRRFTWNSLAGSFDAWLALGLLAALSAILHGWLLCACFGALGLLFTLVLAAGIDDPAVCRRVRLAAWMLSAWFVGLTLTTPLYTPYPRLTLPWIMGGWLAGGLGLSLFVSFLSQVAAGTQAYASGVFHGIALRRFSSPVQRAAILFGIAGLGLFGIYALEARFFRQGFPCWESRTAVKEESAKLLAACDLTESDSAVIYTFAEPALLFQLYLAGARDVYPVASLDFFKTAAPAPEWKRFVVIGSQAIRTGGYELQFEALGDRLCLVSSNCLNPSKVVGLDSRGWMDAGHNRESDSESCRYRVSLYRVR